MMQPGTYYVGDLCYVLRDQSWDAVCSTTIAGKNMLEGQFKLPDGRVIALYCTAYGDGEYNDQYGQAYAVDAGSIGCIRLEDCDVDRAEIEERGLGRIIEFPGSFHTGSDGKILTFGFLQIDTDPKEDYSDTVDEAQEWYDFDPDC